MILVNSQLATLRQFNRTDDNQYFDDQNYKDISIKVVPYDVDDLIKFGIYTIPEAKGFFMVNRNVDVRKGDQIIFKGKFLNKNIELVDKKLTVIEVKDSWIFNRLENQIVIVK
jgi:hypothetical protein